jgi:hypothetical protein
MNRSNKGFGLAGVLVTVIFLIVAAIFSASAKSTSLPQLEKIDVRLVEIALNSRFNQ